MLRRMNKKLALVLVLTMLATMFVGVGTASAATTYYTVTTPTVAEGTTADLGTVLIDVDILVTRATASTFLVTLPSDLEFPGAVNTAGVLTVSKNDNSGDGDGTWEPADVVGTATRLNDREIRVDVIPVDIDYDDVRLKLVLEDIVIDGDRASGPIEIAITGIAGQFSSATVTVATIPGGEVTLSILDEVSIESGGSADLVQITIKEDSAQALEEVDGSLKFKLPKGFTWDIANDNVILVSTSLASADVVKVLSADKRTLIINRTGNTEGKSIYRVSADVVVDDEEAAYGDVVVSVSGKSTFTPSSLTIGTYSDYGYTITVEDPDTTILAGRADEDAEISPFRIKEDVAGSLFNNRTIIMTLPDGCEWINGEIDATNKAGNLNIGGYAYYDNSPNKVKLTINNTTANKGDVKIEAQIAVAVDYTGPITIDMSGSAGVTGEITVAQAIAPLSATCDSVNVIIGAQDQVGADIVITEAQGEALLSSENLVLTAPAGVSFSKLPKVTAEDLSIGTVTRAIGDDGTRYNKVLIPIRGQSDNAGTITITGLYYTVDRTVAEGAMKIAIGGDAVDQAQITNRRTAAVVVAAQNVTSAGASQAYVGSFVIGATNYTLNGVEYTMDVAPFIQNSRTYMPIRYVAHVLGIDDNNIIWDGVNNTVTLMKGDKVVQLKVGSSTLWVNGAAITMEVAPINVAPGRVCLPIRFVANAFGSAVDWDAETQTVSIN